MSRDEPKDSSVNVLDTAVLDELRGLDDEDLRDLVDLYFADVETQLTNLRDSLAANAADGVAAAAHRVKGASLSIGAARVASIAAEIEVAGKADELAGLDELIDTLETELDPTRVALTAELSV
jgi:HPt (histidine-containing phosphotransfer) domain-containing protein